MTGTRLNLLPWPATFSDGAHTEVVAYDSSAQALTLICDRAEPPGRPLELRTRIGDEEIPLHGRSAGSKRREDGKFTVVMRLQSLRREQRALLEHGSGQGSTG
jgi:hypothetical protein